MSRRSSQSIRAALTLPVLLACGEAEPRPDGGWTGTVDTLASGRLVIRNPDAPTWRAGEEWQLRERFRIGRAEGEGPDLFGDIRDLELGENGDVYVLDAQASEVRVFDGAGVHRLTFGRAGQGPGELSRPTGLALDPDGMLWVMNWGNGRYSAFDPGTGDLTRETRRLASFGMIPWPGRFDRAGRLLDIGLSSDGEPAILGLDTAFVPTDTLALPRADDRDQILFRRGDVVVMSMPQPFAPQPSWAAHPDGGIVLGEGGTYRIHRIRLDADTTLTIEVDRAPVPVTGEERDSALAVFRDRSAFAGDGTPDRQPDIADVKPAHGALFVDDQGGIWVRRTSAQGEPPAWDVIAEDGRLLGTVTSPVASGFVPPVVRQDRFAVATSVDDIPTIIVYEIVRPSERADPDFR